MPTDIIKWIEINLKVLDRINDNRSIIGSTEDVAAWTKRYNDQFGVEDEEEYY